MVEAWYLPAAVDAAAAAAAAELDDCATVQVLLPRLSLQVNEKKVIVSAL